VPRDVLEAAGRLPLGGPDFRVLMVLLNTVFGWQKDNGVAQPITNESITEATGLGRTRVWEALSRLREFGVIAVIPSRGRVPNKIGVKAPREWSPAAINRHPVVEGWTPEKKAAIAGPRESPRILATPARTVNRHPGADRQPPPRTEQVNRHPGVNTYIRKSKHSDSQALQPPESTSRGGSTPPPLENPLGTPGLEAAVGVPSSELELLTKAGSGALTILVPRRDSLNEHTRRLRELRAINAAAGAGQ